MLLLILAAVMTSSQAAPTARPNGLGRTALILSTVGHSEWCPAGNVRLDVRTGKYTWTATARRPVCIDPELERPVQQGRLPPDRLASVRAAYLRAQTGGLIDEGCQDGRGPKNVIVSNGGPQVLVLTNGARTTSAPDDLSCWSDAAYALHDMLDRMFGLPPHKR